jgi:hypothetical protein
VGVLDGSPSCLKLVTCESYMTPSCMATHLFFIAIWIRVKFGEAVVEPVDGKKSVNVNVSMLCHIQIKRIISHRKRIPLLN